MSSGRALLADIDRALTESRQSYRKADIELQRASAELARSRQAEARIYRRLAKRRLADLDDESFADALDKADKLAAQLLRERDTQLADLQERIDHMDAAINDLGEQRTSAELALAGHEQSLEDLLADVDATLQNDAHYETLRDDAQRALDTAAAAEEKTAEASARREAKKVPFEADPMFIYLWQRHYGTSAYRAGFFSRFMDRAVARHIRYERARQNYHLLHEIPKRLAAHTERLDQAAAEAAVALADYERQADVAAGAEPLEQRVADAQQSLDALDAKITEQEQAFASAIEEREAFGSGDDPLFRQAMTVLTQQFSAEPIPQLRREAALTPDRDDDAWIDELGGLRDDQRRLEQYLDDHRGLHRKHTQRINELASIRDRYKRKNYDAFNSRIDRHSRLNTMLSEFMHGLLSSEQLWRSIRHAQRFKKVRQRHHHGRRGPNLGSARMPRMPRGVRMPRSVGRSGGGGGFRTKGGF